EELKEEKEKDVEMSVKEGIREEVSGDSVILHWPSNLALVNYSSKKDLVLDYYPVGSDRVTTHFISNVKAPTLNIVSKDYGHKIFQISNSKFDKIVGGYNNAILEIDKESKISTKVEGFVLVRDICTPEEILRPHPEYKNEYIDVRNIPPTFLLATMNNIFSKELVSKGDKLREYSKKMTKLIFSCL